MENMSQALILAFSVLIFVIALTITMSMSSMARTTSDFVIHKSDKTNYYTYDSFKDMEEVNDKRNRTVTIEDIVPVLYRYYKDNIRIEFFQSNGEEKTIYYSQMDNGVDHHNVQIPINYLDIEKEIERHEPWVGNQEKIKENIDALLSGGEFEFPYNSQAYDYDSLIDEFNGIKFKEEVIVNFVEQKTATEYSVEGETTIVTRTDDEEKLTIRYTMLSDD